MQIEFVLRGLVAALVGGLMGFGLYRLIGCPSGACPLMSNPYISVLYGMAVGLAMVWR